MNTFIDSVTEFKAFVASRSGLGLADPVNLEAEWWFFQAGFLDGSGGAKKAFADLTTEALGAGIKAENARRQGDSHVDFVAEFAAFEAGFKAGRGHVDNKSSVVDIVAEFKAFMEDDSM